MLSNCLSDNPFDVGTYPLEYELFEKLPSGIVIINAQGIVHWFNAAAQHLLKHELKKAVWLDVIKKAFAPKEDDGHEISLLNGRRVGIAISSLDSLPGELITLTDLTNTREYEQAKANQKRLIALGRMTAQLAHQIRTPLSSAMIYTEHLMNYPSDQERMTKWITQIQACHTSIEQQLQDLLLFARGDFLELGLANLYDWGKRLEEKVYALMITNVTVLNIDNQLPAMDYFLHEESLLGAVLNLIINAVQAGANCINLSMQYRENKTLFIRLTDNGCGMSDDVKAQAFSPFYTNKANGSGLGLAVVDAVVKAHRGEIFLESAPQQGCCITINLPDNKGLLPREDGL